jgi:homoserine kinase type II
VRPLSDAERQALPELGAAAAVRFTLTRLHDRLFHDPANLVTPKDPTPFFRRLDYWKAAEPA